jgi:hypothetical protein
MNRRNGDLKGRSAIRGAGVVVVAAILPLLGACSSSSSSSDYAADAYPSRSIFSVFRSSKDSAPPPTQTAAAAPAPAAAAPIAPAPAAPANAIATTAPRPAAPPNPAPTVLAQNSAPQSGGVALAGMHAPGVAFTYAPITPAPTKPVAPKAADDDFDAAASAYPSVALFDLIRKNNAEVSADKKAPAAPPILSDSATPKNAAGQPATPGAPATVAANAPAANAAASRDDDFNAAASAYPSQSIFSIFRSSPPSQ